MSDHVLWCRWLRVYRVEWFLIEAVVKHWLMTGISIGEWVLDQIDSTVSTLPEHQNKVLGVLTFTGPRNQVMTAQVNGTGQWNEDQARWYFITIGVGLRYSSL
ncbi:MAG: hypothetical protein AAB499_02690, partial [Patescibacteria group bacterium]